MNKKYYNSQIVKKGDNSYKNREYEVFYYIVSSDMCNVVGVKEKTYGIEIVKKYSDTFGNCISQTFTKNSITSCKYEIVEIIKRLYDKKVVEFT